MFLKAPTTKHSEQQFFSKRNFRIDSTASNGMGLCSGAGSAIKDAITDATTPNSFNSSSKKATRVFFGSQIKADSALKN